LNKKSLITLTIIFFAIISLFAAVCAVYADYEPAGRNLLFWSPTAPIPTPAAAMEANARIISINATERWWPPLKLYTTPDTRYL